MIAPPDHIPDYRRLHVFYAIMASLLVVIVVRLWYLQIVKGPELAAESEMRRTRTVRRLAARGSIEDTHGHILATNRFRFVVSVIPFELNKNPDVLPRLAQILHVPETELSDQIDDDTLTQFDPVPVADDVDVTLLSQIEEQKLDLTGVEISRDPERYYTDDNSLRISLDSPGASRGSRSKASLPPTTRTATMSAPRGWRRRSRRSCAARMAVRSSRSMPKDASWQIWTNCRRPPAIRCD